MKLFDKCISCNYKIIVKSCEWVCQNCKLQSMANDHLMRSFDDGKEVWWDKNDLSLCWVWIEKLSISGDSSYRQIPTLPLNITLERLNQILVFI